MATTNQVMAWLDLIEAHCHNSGMQNTSDIDLVRKRLAALHTERGEIERRLLDIKQEESDLEITARTLARLHKVDLSEAPTRSTNKRGKPADIPTVPDMAEAIMRDAYAKHHRVWIEQSTIVEEIRQRWWPEAESNDITPTLWRVSTKQDPPRFIKDATRYALPEYANAQPPGGGEFSGRAH